MYTVEYPTTGQIGVNKITVTNRYGRFATQKEAQEYLDRVKINGGKVVLASSK